MPEQWLIRGDAVDKRSELRSSLGVNRAPRRSNSCRGCHVLCEWWTWFRGTGSTWDGPFPDRTRSVRGTSRLSAGFVVRILAISAWKDEVYTIFMFFSFFALTDHFPSSHHSLFFFFIPPFTLPALAPTLPLGISCRTVTYLPFSRRKSSNWIQLNFRLNERETHFRGSPLLLVLCVHERGDSTK